MSVIHFNMPQVGRFPYRCTRDVELNLALVRAHQHGKVLAHAAQDVESVVLDQGAEEVLDRVALVLHAHQLLQLGHDLLLVARSEGRGAHDALEPGVLLEDIVEVLEGLGRVVEGLVLCGGRELEAGQSNFSDWMTCRQKTHQSARVGSIDTKQLHWWLDRGLGLSWGRCVCSDAGRGSLWHALSSQSRSPKHGESGRHDCSLDRVGLALS